MVKGFEYAKDIEDHLLVGYNYDLKPPGTVLFWCFYWVSTGLHAVHVTIGIGLIARLLIQGLRSALPLPDHAAARGHGALLAPRRYDLGLPLPLHLPRRPGLVGAVPWTSA